MLSEFAKTIRLQQSITGEIYVRTDDVLKLLDEYAESSRMNDHPIVSHEPDYTDGVASAQAMLAIVFGILASNENNIGCGDHVDPNCKSKADE